MASDKRKSVRARRSGSADSPAADSSAALEALFAEALSSVERRETRPDPGPPAAPPEDDEEFEFEDGFDEQSMYLVVDEVAPEGGLGTDVDLELGDSPGEPAADGLGDEFEDLDAELLAALEDDDDEEDDALDAEISSLLTSVEQSVRAEGAPDDEDPDLAFPAPAPEEPEGAPTETAREGATREVEFDFAAASTRRRRAPARPAEPSVEEIRLRKRVAMLSLQMETQAAELRAARDHAQNLTSQLVGSKRQAAGVAREFDGFRRRAEREREDHRKFAAEKVLKEFLSVFDNLERALEHSGPDREGPLGRGVDMILSQFANALRRHGVERIDSAPGKAFDPAVHEAIGQEHHPELVAGKVVGTMQPGFTLHGRLLRAAMVSVSRGPAPGAASGPEEASAGSPEVAAEPAEAPEGAAPAEPTEAPVDPVDDGLPELDGMLGERWEDADPPEDGDEAGAGPGAEDEGTMHIEVHPTEGIGDEDLFDEDIWGGEDPFAEQEPPAPDEERRAEDSA